MSNRKSLLAAAIALACSVSFSTHVAAEESRKIEIPAGDLRVALETLARQAGIELVYRMDHVNGVRTKGVSGELAPRDAAQRLLEGTPLELRVDPSGAMLISVPVEKGGATVNDDRMTGVPATSALQEGGGEFRLQLAQATSAASTDAQVSHQEPASTETRVSANAVELEEVLVTGSHIRGVQNLSSPVITFDRKDIEASGYSTTQQFIQSLPQNLGTVSTSAFLNGETPGRNDGSGLNLRGLGADSTLVLLNGRRLAAAGVQGNFVDVSLIPLSALERMDILTDGASAIYGSDAVGGVVNLVLRDDFEGVETRLRYGTVTEGSHEELRASQLLGGAWDSGQALLSYEYHRNTALDSSEREFIKPTGWLRNLILVPEQERHGAFGSAFQRLSERTKLSTDFFYSRRTSVSGYDAGLALAVDTRVEQFGGALELAVDVARDWQVRLSGLTNRNEAESLTVGLDNSGIRLPRTGKSSLWSADLMADGSLGRISGGDVRVVLGGQHRVEEFGGPNELSRDIDAAYAEMLLPWVGPESSFAGHPSVRRAPSRRAIRLSEERSSVWK